MKSFESRIQQKINESNNKSTDSTLFAEFKDIQITRTTTTKIKFEKFITHISICATFEKKCWLGFHVTEEGTSLYLLNDSNVIKKIGIPNQYVSVAPQSNLTTNDKGEAVFMNNQSVIAATQDGTVYKLFDIMLHHPFFTPKFCILHSGNYLFAMQVDLTAHIASCIYEFSRDGVLLRKFILNTTLFNVSHITQNYNGDIVLSGYYSFIIFDDDFSIKQIMPIAERGAVVPCMNSRSDLLYGHGQNIDLLRNNGEFVKTVYTTQKDKQIAKIAYSGDGTTWIFYHSDEVNIRELEI